MTREELKIIMSDIKPLDMAAQEAAKKRQAALVKPPESLGELENMTIKLAGIREKLCGSLKKQIILIMSADNGICDEGVSSAPQSVTKAQTINFTRRLTGVSSMAKYFNIDLLVTDVGIKETIPRELYTEKTLSAIVDNKILNRRIKSSTNNFAKTKAMSEQDVLEAIAVGLEVVETIKHGGYDVFGIGEMGIGNTTTSAAVLSAILGIGSEETVGRGGGLNDRSFSRKKEVVDEALMRYGFLHKTEKTDCIDSIEIIDIISAVGGFDIAAMTGAYLGAALYRIPVVVDGYISAVAALCAERLYKEMIGGAECDVRISDFMFASHKSAEKGYILAVEKLELQPILDLKMRLGEGSGCPLAFKILEAAQSSFELMGTFAEAEINDEYLEEIRNGNSF